MTFTFINHNSTKCQIFFSLLYYVQQIKKNLCHFSCVAIVFSLFFYFFFQICFLSLLLPYSLCFFSSSERYLYCFCVCLCNLYYFHFFFILLYYSLYNSDLVVYILLPFLCFFHSVFIICFYNWERKKKRLFLYCIMFLYCITFHFFHPRWNFSMNLWHLIFCLFIK